MPLKFYEDDRNGYTPSGRFNYGRLKSKMIAQAQAFCKEKVGLKTKLITLATDYLGKPMDYDMVDMIASGLVELFDESELDGDYIGLSYTIIQGTQQNTLILFAIIRRDKLYMQKFIVPFQK